MHSPDVNVLVNAFRQDADYNEIFVDENVIERARIPIQRLLNFAAQRKQVIYGNGDA